MKKLIVALVLLSPFAVFGASQIVKEYNLWESFATITVSQSNNVRLLKIDDPQDPNVKCYVAISNSYTDKAFLQSMSCVKVK